MKSDEAAGAVQAGIAIAGEIAKTIIAAIMAGEDIEPLIPSLPPESEKVVRRELEDLETLKQLRETRQEVLGDLDD